MMRDSGSAVAGGVADTGNGSASAGGGGGPETPENRLHRMLAMCHLDSEAEEMLQRRVGGGPQ